jgi:2-polyprenyl-6-hydroxyphenyl methylase/3-demethylubiquinone-9 3-methyltransferase
MGGNVEGITYQYYGNNPGLSHKYLYPVVQSLLSDTPTESVVLDMGCGNGSFLSLFSDKGWRLHGTDFSPTGIEMAKQYHPGINFFIADAQSSAQEIRKQSGPVDVIISTEVIEHLYNPRGFLQTAFELLRPEGRLVITTPYHGYLKNVMLATTGKLDSHFTALWDHGHIKFWSRNTLTSVLEEAGFQVEKFRGAGRLPYLWRSMVLMARKP